jgi:hypothetical protein
MNKKLEMTNYAQEILDIFNVVINEDFNIGNIYGISFGLNPYHFDESMNICDNHCRESNYILQELITGKLKLIKIEKFVEPIYCEEGEVYSHIMSNGYQRELQFVGGAQDYYNRKMKNMFPRDTKLPQAQINEIIKEMKS